LSGGRRFNFGRLVAKFFFGISTTLFVERYQKEDNMAMSQGERMMRLQEESNRFLSRRQTKDSGQQTLIVQAKRLATYLIRIGLLRV
jgi:hypothetical protein